MDFWFPALKSVGGCERQRVVTFDTPLAHARSYTEQAARHCYSTVARDASCESVNGMARSPRALFSPVARFALMSSMAALACDNAWAASLARSRLTAAIDTSGFRDATNHW